jgi:hypothetical protein
MKKNRFDLIPYYIKFRISMITVLVVMIMLFKYGPEMIRPNQNFQNLNNNNQITIDLIEITTQSTPPSAPPRPRIPVRTLTDPVVTETDIDVVFDVPIRLDPGIDRTEGQNVGLVVRNPQRPPRVQRIVEPVSPERSSNVEIIAELTIGTDGRVEEVRIVSIRRRNSSTGQMESLNEIDDSYIQATREAAFQWLFRPATEQGSPVRSVSEHVFTFGRGIN